MKKKAELKIKQIDDHFNVIKNEISDHQVKLNGKEEQQANNQLFLREIEKYRIAMDFFECKYLPSQIRFREREREEILLFIDECQTKKRTNHNLLISGLPGCGKSLLVKNILINLQKECNNISIYQKNAMEFNNNAHQLLSFFKESLKNHSVQSSYQDENLVKEIKKISENLSKNQMIIFFIDEIDVLFQCNSSSAIFEIFNISSSPHSNIILIGVSNTMELIYNFYKQFDTSAIKNIVFQPYTFENILQLAEQRIEQWILSSKLKQELFQENSLKFLVGRMLKMKGSDVRCFFGIIKEALLKKYKEAMKLNKFPSSISLNDLIQIFKEIYPSNSSKEIISNLSPNQQLLLVSIHNIMAYSDNQTFSLNDVMHYYNIICAILNYPKQGLSDISESLSNLLMYKIIEIQQPSKQQKARSKQVDKNQYQFNGADKILSKISKEQIREAIQDLEDIAKFLA